MSELTTLQSTIKHTFKDQELLLRALTHRSHGAAHNERLEFLGDAVLGLIIGSALYEKFPQATEGQLSRMRSNLVRKQTLAAVAHELMLGQHLIMGQGERQPSGVIRDAMLVDAFEAVIGAIMLDGGFEVANRFVLAQFSERLAGLSLKNIRKDAKSRLQEHLQGLGKPLPEYHLLSSIGAPPQEEFEVECCVLSLPASVRAKGNTRQQAEQEAAGLALDSLGVGS